MALVVGDGLDDTIQEDTPNKKKYYWYRYDDIGFPERVNHAAAAHVDEKTGGAYVFSFGGYHADQETRARADYREHIFRSADIDVHKFDVGKWSYFDLFISLGRVRLGACGVTVQPRYQWWPWPEISEELK